MPFILALIIPDFSLILLGLALHRHGGLAPQFWPQLEKVVYYVLFPALLFGALARMQPGFAAAVALIETGIAFLTVGMLLGYVARRLFRPPPMVFASGFQCAYRFNSYIGFAIMGGLHGHDGIATFGLLAGFLIPLANVVSVLALAKHGKTPWMSEILRNPLILSTVAGLLWSGAGLQLPQAADNTLALLGEAALPMGLLAVGAGLRRMESSTLKGFMIYLTLVKLIAVPAAAYVVGRWLALPPLYFHAALVLAALPTASSAYILAVRMNGDGALVASLVALNVLVAAISLPIWLALAGV